MPTGLLEVYLPKAAVADQPRKWKTTSGRSAFADPDAYLWLTLKPGKWWRISGQHPTCWTWRWTITAWRTWSTSSAAPWTGRSRAPAFSKPRWTNPKGEGAGTLMELLPYLTGVGFAVFGGIIAMTVVGG